MSRRRRKALADYTPRGLAGLKGFWVTCNGHFGGDPRLMVNVLIWRGLIAVVRRPLAALRLPSGRPHSPCPPPDHQPRPARHPAEWQAILDQHREEIAELEGDYTTMRDEFSARMHQHTTALRQLWRQISAEMDAQIPDLADYPIPEPAEADEREEALYNSARGYLEQIEEYKAFQGRA
jgi:hypothetical protein